METTLSTTHGLLLEPPSASLESEERTDQRARDRYPISLELQYKVLRGGRVAQAGTGRTLNISSGGVLFETDDRLPQRGLVELDLQWPYLLQGVCGLKLVMRGHIVRSGANRRETAVRAEFREFRTRGVRRQDANPKAAASAR
jgi:hypothetical protein